MELVRFSNEESKVMYRHSTLDQKIVYWTNTVEVARIMAESPFDARHAVLSTALFESGRVLSKLAW